MSDCIFCKIAKGEVPSEKVKESSKVVAFLDNDPSADTHILIVPKKHIETFLDIKQKEHAAILAEMLKMAQELVKEKKLQKKYKIVINGGENQYVPHLHWHVLGGEMKKKV
jgi:histidine triad (HIT) family protein